MADADGPRLLALRREPGAMTRSLTALVLRLTLGLSLLMFGVQKYQAQRAGQYPGGMVAQFDETWLGQKMPQAVKLFADALPYAEIGLGALLVAGLTTTMVAFLTGLLLVGLLFGQLILATVDQATYGPKIPIHLLWVLTDAAVLWLSPVTSNYLSVDGLLFGWFWKPRSEGEFRREEQADPRVKKYS